MRCYDIDIDDFGAGIITRDGSLAAFSAAIPAIFDASSGKRLSKSENSNLLSDIAVFSPNGRQIYASDNSSSRLLDLVSGRLLWSSTSIRSCDLHSFAFSANAKLLVQSRTTDNRLVLIDTSTGHELSALQPAGAQLTRVAFIGASHKLIAATTRGEVLIFDMDKRAQIARKQVSTKNIKVLAIQPGGDIALTGDESGKWCRFHIEGQDNPQCIQRTAGAEDGVLLADGWRAIVSEVDSDGSYHHYSIDLTSGSVLKDYGTSIVAVAVNGSGGVVYRDEKISTTDKGILLQNFPSDRSIEFCCIFDRRQLTRTSEHRWGIEPQSN